MFWLDYTIETGVNKFRVKGDTDMELIEKGLYQPGDVYIVGEDGWLRKVDKLTETIYNYENKEC
jgi:hypothetical protein